MNIKRMLALNLILYFCVGCSQSKSLLCLKINKDSIENNIGTFETKMDAIGEYIFEIELVNNTEFDLRLLKKYDSFNHYGIGCNVLFWNKLTDEVEISKLYLKEVAIKKFVGSKVKISKISDSLVLKKLISPNKMLFNNFKAIEEQLKKNEEDEVLILNRNSRLLLSYKINKNSLPRLPIIEDENEIEIPENKLWRIFIRPHSFFAYQEHTGTLIKRIYISDVKINFAD